MLLVRDIECEPLITLRLDVQPKAIQSVRFSARCGYVQTFQPKANKEWKLLVKSAAFAQLPPNWKRLGGVPLWVEVTYVFPPLKSFRKAEREWIEAGNYIFKDTKPDVNDNLNKGLYDALTGVLWEDDALVAWPSSQKIYGKEPGIYISAGVLPKLVRSKGVE